MMECNIEYLEIKNDVFREEIINPTLRLRRLSLNLVENVIIQY